MATTKTFAGQSFNLPLNREPKSSNWGTETSNFLIALADYAIPKTGGAYTLSAELNLGATYGVLLPYVKSATANIAAAGAVRLARADTVSWRNQANGADLALAVDSSNRLTFDGTIVMPQSVAAAASPTFAGLTLTAFSGVVKATAGVLSAATIVNADVSASAAIAYTKLALSASIVNADIATGAAIAYSKLNLATSIVNADVSASAAIAYSKLSLAGSIATADLASGLLVPIGKGGTGQTTAQTAIDALVPSQTSNSGKVLGTDGTNVSWVAGLSTTLANGKFLVGNGSSIATAVTPTGDVTFDNAGLFAIASGVIVNADINASAAIAGSKLVAAASGVAGAVSATTQTLTGIKTFETQLIGKGTATNDSAAAGYIGEYMEGKQASSSVGTSGQYWDAGSTSPLTLTAGDWDVQGTISFNFNSATVASPLLVATLGFVTGNDSTGFTAGQTGNIFSTATGAIPRLVTLSTPVVRVTSDGTNLYMNGSTLSSSQAIRLKGYIESYSAATPTYTAVLRARRVR